MGECHLLGCFVVAVLLQQFLYDPLKINICTGNHVTGRQTFNMVVKRKLNVFIPTCKIRSRRRKKGDTYLYRTIMLHCCVVTQICIHYFLNMEQFNVFGNLGHFLDEHVKEIDTPLWMLNIV